MLFLFNHFPCTLWAQEVGNIPMLEYPQDINLLDTDTYINNLPTGKTMDLENYEVFY